MNRLAKFFLFVIFPLSLIYISAGTYTNVLAQNKLDNIELLCDGAYTKLKDLVANPKAYKGKRVKLLGDFYSFSSLPLDYPPAMRDAKSYIGIVLARPDQKQVPLVELKLAVKLDMFKNMEEELNLAQGDTLKINARVFEVALGEPWLDVSSIEVVSKAAKKDT